MGEKDVRQLLDGLYFVGNCMRGDLPSQISSRRGKLVFWISLMIFCDRFLPEWL